MHILYSRIQKRECNVITLQKTSYSTLYFNYSAYYTRTIYTKLQMLLHKTTDRTTQNYAILQTKLHAHATISKLHTKLTQQCSYKRIIYTRN